MDLEIYSVSNETRKEVNVSTHAGSNDSCVNGHDHTTVSIMFTLDIITLLSNVLIIIIISLARMGPTSVPLQSHAVTDIATSFLFMFTSSSNLMCSRYIKASIAFTFSNSSQMLAVATFILYLTLCRSTFYKKYGTRRNICVLTVIVAVWNVLIGALTFLGKHGTPFSFKDSDLWIGICLIVNIFAFPTIVSVFSNVAILRYMYAIWKRRILLTEPMKKNLMLVAFHTTLIVLYNVTLLPMMVCLALKYNGYMESNSVALVEYIFSYLNYAYLLSKDILFVYIYLTFKRNRERSLWV